jgi:hypothetical protein
MTIRLKDMFELGSMKLDNKTIKQDPNTCKSALNMAKLPPQQQQQDQLEAEVSNIQSLVLGLESTKTPAGTELSTPAINPSVDSHVDMLKPEDLVRLVGPCVVHFLLPN